MDYTFRAQADEGSEMVNIVLTVGGRGYDAWIGRVMFSSLSIQSKITNKALVACDVDQLVCTFRVNRDDHPDWKTICNSALATARRVVAKRRTQFPAVNSCWEA